MNKLFPLFLAAILLVVSPCYAAQTRVALVIGNSAYVSAPLATPVNDAADVAAALRKIGFEVIEKRDADQEEMDHAVALFAEKLKGETIGLFYYAGHAIQVKGKNYLVPIGARLDSDVSVRADTIAVETLFGELAGGSRNMVILDACHNSPFELNARTSVDGLAKMIPPRGALIAYAAAPGRAVAGVGGRNGLYARELLKLLQTPDISAESLFKRLRGNVAKASGKEQVPWEASSLSEDFYINPSQANPQYAFSSELYRPNLEDEVWKVAQASGGEEWLKSYLQEFPKGTYAAVARIKLAALRKGGRAEEAQLYANFPIAGSTFRDCPECPEMVVIPAGRFQMGSNDDDREQPIHTVTIAKPFALGRTEVTQEQWSAIMGSNPSAFDKCGGDCPVEQVSWEDAKAFVWKLSARTGEQYRLPSEAEWEYAAKAGSEARYPWGNDERQACRYANVRDRKNFLVGGFDCDDDYGDTAPVARFAPNAFGLYDMIGNVWEWVEDCGNVSFDDAPEDGSAWTSGDCEARVLRGGSWSGKPEGMRAAVRSRIGKTFRINYIGFRVARNLP